MIEDALAFVLEFFMNAFIRFALVSSAIAIVFEMQEVRIGKMSAGDFDEFDDILDGIDEALDDIFGDDDDGETAIDSGSVRKGRLQPCHDRSNVSEQDLQDAFIRSRPWWTT